MGVIRFVHHCLQLLLIKVRNKTCANCISKSIYDEASTKNGLKIKPPSIQLWILEVYVCWFFNWIHEFTQFVHSVWSSSNHTPINYRCLIRNNNQLDLRIPWGPRPRNSKNQAILLVESKILDPKSLHWGPSPKYEENEVMLMWHLHHFLRKSHWSQLKKTLHPI